MKNRSNGGFQRGRCTGNRSEASQCRTRRAGAKAVLQASQDGDAKQQRSSPPWRAAKQPANKERGGRIFSFKSYITRSFALVRNIQANGDFQGEPWNAPLESPQREFTSRRRNSNQEGVSQSAKLLIINKIPRV